MADDAFPGDNWLPPDEEDTKAERQFANTKDAVVFLIDAGPTMQAQHGVALAADQQQFANMSGMELALQLVQATERHKILAGDFDLAAVVLYNTREKAAAGSCDFDHVYTLQDNFPPPRDDIAEEPLERAHLRASGAMDVPTARRIQTLTQLSGAWFQQHIGSCGAEVDREAALTHALWTASDLISEATKGRRAGARRVLLLTNDPAPLRPGSEGRPLQTRAMLMKETGTTIQVVPLCAAVAGGGERGIYARLHNEPDAPPLVDAAAGGLSELQEQLKRRAAKKRRLGVLELRVEPGAAGDAPAAAPAPGAPAALMAVGLYSTLHAASTGTTQQLHRSDYVPLKATTSFSENATGSMLSPEDIARSLPYGAGAGAHVVMSPVEAAAAKRPPPGLPGLRVLGFAPAAAALRRDASLRPAYFLYPEEVARPGSAAAFAALHAALLARGAVAIAVLARSPAAQPRLAALVPQAEVLDGGTGAQRYAPGMHVVSLPYAEDVRAGVPAAVLPPRRAGADAAAAASEAEDAARLASAAGRLVSLLPFEDFRCEDIPNPALEHFYAYLENKALAEPVEAAPAVDGTLPQLAAVAGLPEAAAALRAELDQLAPPEEEAPGAAGGRKRKAEEPADAAAKAAAAEEGAALVFRLFGEQGAIGVKRAKVDDLKAFLKSRGLKPGAAKKDELVQKCVAALEDE